MKLRWLMVVICLLVMGRSEAQFNAWLQSYQEALAKGQLDNAMQGYDAAMKSIVDADERAIATIQVGELLLKSGFTEKAEQILADAYQQATLSNNSKLLGELKLRLGLVASTKNERTTAYRLFAEAFQQAETKNEHLLAATAALDAFKQIPEPVWMQRFNYHSQAILDSTQKNHLLIGFAYAVLQTEYWTQAEQLLADVLPQSTRQSSQLLGNKGLLAEKQGKVEASLDLTEQAIIADSSPDLLMRWQWQRGRLLNALNRPDEAISAYRQAVTYLQTIKVDIPIVYQNGESSFKTTYAPLYMALIQNLWQSIAKHANQPHILEEIIGYWEQLKAIELQDYFREACLAQHKPEYMQIGKKTAVLYPILLPEHVILIVRFADDLHAIQVSASQIEIKQSSEQLIKELLSPLTGTTLPVTSNIKLYHWLIEPIQAELAARHIDTLIYIPDGPLRKVPLSLLSDGRHFLAEYYQIATEPALSLLSSTSQDTPIKALLVGMSKPGPVVYELLNANFAVPDSEENNQRGDKHNLMFEQGRLIFPKIKTQTTARKIEKTIELRDFNQGLNDTQRDLSLLRVQQLQSALALPGVTKELKSLATTLNVKPLENESFTLANFKHKISDSMSIVHIATHGFFSGDSKKSFVMAYDHLINMAQFSSIFKNQAFQKNPVDLITLSACQTAEGDDRSPLGLSGLVVQTGVKSAVGTLWPVADEAAQEFFSYFYQNYLKNGSNKAQALQAAQQYLIKHKTLNHPLYWAPFVLIGDWM